MTTKTQNCNTKYKTNRQNKTLTDKTEPWQIKTEHQQIKQNT